jgi:hypothetical protein
MGPDISVDGGNILERATNPECGLTAPVSYADYHRLSRQSGDCDPAYEMLRYVCDRFELNTEQRYWLAFLYATCYCGATVYYAYNEFPDWENVDFGRLERWWAANKGSLFFQTDRRWIKSRDQWCDVVRSYTRHVAPHGTQEAAFARFRTRDERLAYKLLFEDMGRIYQMGRYGLFLYLEAVHVVTGFPMEPDTMDMRESSAESSRNGLAYAIGEPDLSVHGTGRRLNPQQVRYLQARFDTMVKEFRAQDQTDGVWSLETTLCAYKKYRIGKRYVGYYLDRQASEISKMEEDIRHGVDWSVLWDYRRETYEPRWLEEAR